MVKTPHGRKPGPRHARIVKQLRHRRRMAAARAAAHTSPSETQSTTDSTFSTLTTRSTLSTLTSTSTATLPILSYQADMKYLPIPLPRPQPRHFTLAEMKQLLSMEDDDDDAVVETVSDAPVDEDKQMVLYNSAAGKVVNRGVSEAAAVGFAAGKNFDRSIVSESDLHLTAIPMPAPPVVAEVVLTVNDEKCADDDASTAHEGHFTDDEDEEDDVHPVVVAPPPSHHHLHDDEERLQHPDEHTDRYLSNLFAPSIANITTALDEYITHNESHAEEFQRLRNLFSSDSLHTIHSKLATVGSETSFGLNTLFNNRSVRNVSSHDTSMGLRTLFEEKYHHNQQHPHHHSEKFVPGFPTILSETCLDLNNVSSNYTSLGLRTLFEEKTDAVEEKVADVPAVDDEEVRVVSEPCDYSCKTCSRRVYWSAGKSVASETSLGLNTLFNNNNRTARNVSTHDTSFGIRTLFEEKSEAVVEKVPAEAVVVEKVAVEAVMENVTATGGFYENLFKKFGQFMDEHFAQNYTHTEDLQLLLNLFSSNA